MYSCTLLLVFISWIEKFKVQYSKLSTNKLTKDSIYLDGMVNISNVLNKGLCEVLDVDPLMILIIFFCNWNTFLLTGEFPQNMKSYPLWNENKHLLSVDMSLRYCMVLIT